MKENFSVRRGNRHYRYFVCSTDEKRLQSTCPLKHVPAPELEKLVLQEIGKLLNSPETLAGILGETGKAIEKSQIHSAMENLNSVWEVMFPVEQYKFIRSIVSRITVYPDMVKIRYNIEGIETLVNQTIGAKHQCATSRDSPTAK